MAAQTIAKNAAQILKFLAESRSFDRVLKNVVVTSASEGRLCCELKVDEEHLNRGGSVHGGFTSTLVDTISTAAIMTADKPPGVSVDLHIKFLSAAHLADTLVITAECQKIGKTLAFATVDIHKKSGQLIASGSHTKFLGSQDQSSSKP